MPNGGLFTQVPAVVPDLALGQNCSTASALRITGPDGSDDPAGRQKNRRVEITVRTL
jgi:hypothetical protein